MNSEPNLDLSISSLMELITTDGQTSEILNNFKLLIQCLNQIEVIVAEQSIFKHVFPVIIHHFERVYNTNLSLSETMEDEIIDILLRENFETAIKLTENIKEVLNFILQQCPINLIDIESIIRNVPCCVLLFTQHFKKCSEDYKTTFNMEMSNLLEVVKELYDLFLHLINDLIIGKENNVDVLLLIDALHVICEISEALSDINLTSVISSWKCFNSMSIKYATLLEDVLNLNIPVNALTEEIYKGLLTLPNQAVQAFNCQIKVINYLIKILFKICKTFYQQLDKYSLKLIIFLVKVLSLTSDRFKSQNFSDEALYLMEREIFNTLENFLSNLLINQSFFKDEIKKIPQYLQKNEIFQEYSIGVVNVLSTTLKVMALSENTNSQLTINIISSIYEALCLCQKELFWECCNGGLYQALIINMSVGILLQDNYCSSTEIVMKNIFHEEPFIAILSIEVYTLVMSNLTSEECQIMMINLLGGINELLCGAFTHRPETVYLRILINRLFDILPNALIGEIAKIFKPESCMHIWKFLGLDRLLVDQVQFLLSPIVDSTTSSIKNCILGITNEALILDIVKGLELLCNVNNLNVSILRTEEIQSFVVSFWESDLTSDDILENNFVKMLLPKVVKFTSATFNTFPPDKLNTIIAKLKALSSKPSYAVCVYETIYSILTHSSKALDIHGVSQQHLVQQFADSINICLQNPCTSIIQENYLELLYELHVSQKHVSNILQNNFGRNVSEKMLNYLETIPVDIDYENLSYRNAFTHKCLKWSPVTNFGIQPPVKKLKREHLPSNPQVKCNLKEVVRRGVHNPTISEPDDESSASDVIDRLKGEVKCLFTVLKTEKLTPKNVSDLRITLSQLSSLM